MVQKKDDGMKLKLGEILVKNKIITPKKLESALKRQSQVGGQIGSILIEMGYITTDTLLDFLSKQFGVPSVNLFKLDVDPKILKVLPLDKIKEYKVIPIKVGDRITLAMVDPSDYISIKDVEFILGRRVSPVVVPASHMDAALKSFEAEGVQELKGTNVEDGFVKVSGTIKSIRKLLKQIAELKATNLQLTAGVPPSLKVGNELRRLNMPFLTPKQVDLYAKSIMSKEQQKKFELESNLEFVFADEELGRFRINIYKQRNSVSITIRYTSDHIPSFKELGLPDELEKFVLKPQGLILITGPACQGKTTTLAAMINVINTKRRCNIISLEDPIEFLHKHKNCNVNQREIGIDTVSFQAGLKQIFRQDPDVIVVGEMRDMESFKIALQAAESGHLVLSTLHSKNATQTIERIIDIFLPHQQAQVRYQLADTLILVLSQRLIPDKSNSGLVLAYEKLVNSYKIRNLIREGKTHLIRSQMQHTSDDYVSIDVNLARLCIEGRIAVDDGERYADNPSFFQELIKKEGIQQV